MVRGNEERRDASPQAVKQTRRAALRGLLVAGLLVWLSGSARALIVGATPNVIPNTATAPANDPGFLNSVKIGNFSSGVCLSNCYNATYLGDGWVLTARHVGDFYPAKFDHIATPFTMIPNQGYYIANPAGLGLTEFTDLRLYRIKGDAANLDPGVPKLTIGSQPLTLDASVTYVGNGVTRAAAESHYSVDNSVNPPTWTEVASRSTYNGYKPGGGGKLWGTNNIANDNVVLNETDPDLTAILTPNGRSVISYLSVFDENSSNPNETQAVGGDSGGSVFYNRSGQWELVGVVNANLIYPGQSVLGVFNSSNSLAIYGNATAFADLSSYRNEILSIMNAHADYSVAGDVNLDGLVTGDGTGPTATDDISAFVQGWRYDNGTGQGNILSWSKGDLNHDGKVNASDFFKLRQAFGATGSSATSFTALATAMLGIAVPEPSTAVLLLLAAGSFLATARRRRSLSFN